MKKTLLIIFIFFIHFTNAQVIQIQRPMNYQLHGGSEFIIKHRPDIADSAYQVRFRFERMCNNCHETTPIFYSSPYNATITLTDSCDFKNHAIFTYLYTSPYAPFNKNRLKINPYTGDSNNKQFFQSCVAYPPLQLEPPLEMKILNTPIKDTYLLIRDDWYDTIIYLPEKCGKWQIFNGFGITANDRVLLGQPQVGPAFSTNLDSLAPFGPLTFLFYSLRGISQINNLVSNGNPYFLSHPTAVFYRNVPAVYKKML